MKKKLLACSLLVIGLSTAAYGTVAYFTHEDTATNVITAGDIQIALQEWTVPEEGGEPVPFEDVIDVLPGRRGVQNRRGEEHRRPDRLHPRRRR